VPHDRRGAQAPTQGVVARSRVELASARAIVGVVSRKCSIPSRSRGRARRKPWPKSQCSCWSVRNWACSSIPSRASRAERLAKLDECVDERARGLRRGGDAGDEGAVDLESVDRELAEVSKGAVAGSKSSIAIRTPSALRASSRVAAHADVDHEGRLGDLERERQQGRAPLRRRAPCTSVDERSVSSWRPETLTAIPIRCPRLQPAACSQPPSAPAFRSGRSAWSVRQAGMKRSGGMTPRVGCRQPDERFDTG